MLSPGGKSSINVGVEMDCFSEEAGENLRKALQDVHAS
jgi:hypothetical protein